MEITFVNNLVILIISVVKYIDRIKNKKKFLLFFVHYVTILFRILVYIKYTY
jgi:hypothetical protein